MDPATIAMLVGSLVPGLLGGGGGSDPLSGLLTTFAGSSSPGTATGAISSSSGNPLASLIGTVGKLFGLGGGMSRGAMFRAGVRQQIAQGPLAGAVSTLRSAGFNPAVLRGTSAGAALLQVANQIDQAGGWQAVAQGAGPLKVLRKTWQYLLTGEMVDPKRPIPTTAQVRAALAPTGSSSGTGAYSLAMPRAYSSPTLVGGSYWSRMGTVYGGV